MPKQKYHLVEKNEHEILMDEFFVDKNKTEENKSSIFDYKSINDYNSIFKYRSSNAMMRSNNAIDFGIEKSYILFFLVSKINNVYFSVETKPLDGVELMLTYFIIGLFYVAMVLLMPFSLLFCLKVT